MKRIKLITAALAFVAIAAVLTCSCISPVDPGPDPEPDVDPVVPVEPVDPVTPDNPVTPVEPVEPVEPEIPVLFHSEDIENEGVRLFLENVDYSADTEYSQSFVQDYDGTDKPLPVKLVWDGDGASVLVSTSDKLDVDVKSFEVSGSSLEIYNMIPGVPYYYKVLSSEGTVLKLGCVTPVGPLRMIHGVTSNMRDLGGWAADGGRIAYGKLYRGARLDDIQKDSSAVDIFLNTLGVDVELDLRGLPPGRQGGSGEKNPWPSSSPVEYCNIQLWNYMHPSNKQYSNPDIADGTTADQYQFAIRKIIGWLGEGKTVYFHCHGGADRTGTLAFLIEALLGVSESDMSKEFELTTYAGSVHKRDGSAGWFFAPMVKYLRSFAPEGNIKDQVTAWAMARHSESVDPLSPEEISLLREYLIVRE